MTSGKIFHYLLWLSFTMGVIFHSANAAPPEEYAFLDLTAALKQAGSENKPVMLYFGRYGCSTCRKMHEEVFSDKSLLQAYANNFILAYVDTESSNRIKLPTGERTTEMQFASRSRILGTPTFVYFSHEQKPLFQKAGFQSIDQMKQYSDYISSLDYKTLTLPEYVARQ